MITVLYVMGMMLASFSGYEAYLFSNNANLGYCVTFGLLSVNIVTWISSVATREKMKKLQSK